MEAKERFLKYVSFDTTSDENSMTVPSSGKISEFGKLLADELGKIGAKDAHIDEKGYVYAWLPATKGRETEKAIGLIAHMDTSPAVSGENIRPRELLYEGGDIALNDGIVMKASAFEILERYVGQKLIVTDGTTLLGADDKAGIAEIMTAVERIAADPSFAHPKLCIAFTPDEEIGRGADYFDINKFGAEYAYTVDGGTLGEIEYENFNAASAKFTVNGINIHPGSAKNKMKNACLIAAELIEMFPDAETPAHTEGREGFYHVCDLAGNESSAVVNMIIRDHDRELFEARKQFAGSVAGYLNQKYGEKTVVAEIEDSYYNMKEKILPVFWIFS